MRFDDVLHAAGTSGQGLALDLVRIAFGLQTPSGALYGVALLLVGMLLITWGGDIFTDCAVAIARSLRVPPVIIGATIVSVATTFPEFMVSLTGVLRGQADFAVGNALGSCCCNIGLIVGTCVMLKACLARSRGDEPFIAVSRTTLSGPGLFMVASGILVWASAAFDTGSAMTPEHTAAAWGIARWQAGILAVVLVVYLVFSLRVAMRARYETELNDKEAEAEEDIRSHMARTVLGFLAGALLVVLGARLLVANAETLARQMGVPELIIGLTVLAIGTSLPEYTVSLLAVVKGHGALGLGNIVGANILNICWVVATCALISPVPIREQTLKLDAPVVLLLMCLLVGLAWKRQRLAAGAGAVLFAVYISYLILMFVAFPA